MRTQIPLSYLGAPKGMLREGRRGPVLYYNHLTYRLDFDQGKTEWLEEKQVIKK